MNVTRDSQQVTHAYEQLIACLLWCREISKLLVDARQMAADRKDKDLLRTVERIGTLNGEINAAFQTARAHLDALPQSADLRILAKAEKAAARQEGATV